MAILDDIEVAIVSTRNGKAYTENIRTDLDSRHKEICVDKCISSDYNGIPPHAKGISPLVRERWIEAETDAGFELHITLKKGFVWRSEGINVNVDIDGGVCKFSHFKERPQAQRKSKGIEADMTFKIDSVMCKRQKDHKYYSAAMTFTEIAFCDPNKLPGVKIPGTGAIEIDIHRIKCVHGHESPKPLGSTAIVRDGRFDIGVNDVRNDFSPTHKFHVGVVTEIEQPKNMELDLDILLGRFNRRKVFKFFYRSKESLRTLGCIPASPPATTTTAPETSSSRGTSPSLATYLDHLTDAEALSEINTLRTTLESEKDRNSILADRLRDRDTTSKLEVSLHTSLKSTISSQETKILDQQTVINNLRTELTNSRTESSGKERESVKRLSFQLQGANGQLRKVQGAYDKKVDEVRGFKRVSDGMRALLGAGFGGSDVGARLGAGVGTGVDNTTSIATGSKRKAPATQDAEEGDVQGASKRIKISESQAETAKAKPPNYPGIIRPSPAMVAAKMDPFLRQRVGSTASYGSSKNSAPGYGNSGDGIATQRSASLFGGPFSFDFTSPPPGDIGMTSTPVATMGGMGIGTGSSAGPAEEATIPTTGTSMTEAGDDTNDSEENMGKGKAKAMDLPSIESVLDTHTATHTPTHEGDDTVQYQAEEEKEAETQPQGEEDTDHYIF